MLGGGIASVSPAHAGTDDFLNDLNNSGIGNRDDPHNFDLVGFGNVICWRLYGGEAPGQIAEMVFANSRTGKQAELTHDQADAAVRFAYPTCARTRHRSPRRPGRADRILLI